MKIQITEQTTKEVEFPIPSFWEHYGSRTMVTENNLTWVADGMAVTCNKESSFYQSKIQEIITSSSYKEISADEFFEHYNKAIETIKEAVAIEVLN